MGYFLNALFLLTGSLTFATSAFPNEENLRSLSETRGWRVLLHAQSRSGKSEILNGDFFAGGKEGHNDPLVELKADLKAFHAGSLIGSEKIPAQCAYPARYHFLKEQLNLQIKDIECPDLLDWKSRFNAESITVIFASYYLTNPVSTFGHVFFRIDSAPEKQAKKDELLDMTFGFAAAADPQDGAGTFAFKGLFGGYEDRLTMSSYHERLGQYFSMESREIWEYKLSLSPPQVNRLLEHIWEFRWAHLTYYFFDRNCNSHMLSLLEVANPEWNLTEDFRPWSIPSDGIRKLIEYPGVVKSVRFRPPSETLLLRDYRSLTEEEKKEFHRMKDNLQSAEPSSGLLVETLLEYKNNSIRPYGRNLTEAEKRDQGRLFEKLALLPSDDRQRLPITEAGQPGTGLKSSKLGIYAGGDNDGNYSGLTIQPAFHDLLDPNKGYPPVAEVALGRTNFRYRNRGNLIHLQSFEIVDLVSLRPVNDLKWAPSWLGKVHIFTPTEIPGASDRNAFGVTGGVGYSGWLNDEQNLLIFSFIKIAADGGSIFGKGYRLGSSYIAGMMGSMSDSIKGRIQGETFVFTDSSDDSLAPTRFSKLTAEFAFTYLGGSHGPQLHISSNLYHFGSTQFVDGQMGLITFF